MIQIKAISVCVLLVILNGVRGEVEEVEDNNDTVLRRNRRVLGGERKSIEDYPYMVRITNKNRDFTCGGAILSETWVLTAAHCHLGDDQYIVQSGVSSVREKGTIHKVAKFIPHAEYDFDTEKNDIALIKLETPFKWDTKHQPVKILEKDVTKPNDTGVVAGYGHAGSHPNSMIGSGLLYAVSLPFVSEEECQEPCDDFECKYIGEMTICAGYYGRDIQKDVCKGDSGSPILFNGKIAGLVSWGSDCDEDDERIYGVYTKVSAYQHWIKRIMRFHRS